MINEESICVKNFERDFDGPITIVIWSKGVRLWSEEVYGGHVTIPHNILKEVLEFIQEEADQILRSSEQKVSQDE